MGRVITLRNRRNIEAQGFLGLDDVEIARLDGWLRFSPAVCMTWTAIGVFLAAPAVLIALVPFALLGGLLKGHPFDVVYNHAIRHITRGPRIPAYGKPRRFGCLMASAVLSIAAAGFAFGVPAVGYALGSLMVLMAGVNVTTGFCIPSFTYGKLFGEVKKVSEEPAV